VRFLDKSVPVDFQRDVVHPSRRTAVERRLDQRLQDVPNLRPAFVDALRH
jgi:hypothetical protein